MAGDMSLTPPRSRYRPEIDGLRAFAVAAVIINHFNKNLLPSGYLGVDIFFVISGYVITLSLAGRKSKNYLDFLMGFYERRIKRLIPALVVFVLVTGVLISLFNPTPEVALKTGATSLFGLSNLYLFKTSTDYFAESTELNPFIHTWSLGVEEQFYLVFPFLIWFSGFKQQSAKGARNFCLWVGALSVTSLVGFIYLYPINQAAAYFLMPFRFWEMAAGCLLFVALQRREKVRQALKSVPPLAIVAAIVGILFLPVSAAVPATIAVVSLSVVLIGCLKQDTSAYRLFTHPKIVYIGMISYSLYLWHWTVLSISRWTIGIHWWTAPWQCLTMLGMAALTSKLIERPMQRAKWSIHPWGNVLLGTGISALAAAAILGGRSYSQSFYLGERGLSWNGISPEACFSGKKYTRLELVKGCTLKPKNSNLPSIIAIGDSQTGHLLPLLNRLHSTMGVGLMYYTQADINFPAIREARSEYAKTLADFDDLYGRHLAAFSTFLDSARARDIMLISSRFEKRWGASPETNAQGELPLYFDKNNRQYKADEVTGKWKDLFPDLIAKAEAKGIHIIILTSFPKTQGNIPKCLSDPQWFNNFRWCTDKSKNLSRVFMATNAKPVDDYFKTLASSSKSVDVFDQFSILCPTNECSPSYTHDGLHLSRQGEKRLYKHLEDMLHGGKLQGKGFNNSAR